MRDRVERLLNIFPLPTFVGTFHRYALTLLRRYGERVGLPRDFAILDTDDQKRLVTQAMAAEGVSETSFPPRTILAAISGAKNRLLSSAAVRARGEGLLRAARGARLPPLPVAGRAGLGRRLRRHDEPRGEALHRAQGDRRPPAAAHPLPARRRVPGHQPGAAHPGLRARRGERQPDRRRRRGPGHLSLARRRPDEHPRVRAPLSRRRGAQARAQLPLDRHHPGRRQRRGRRNNQSAARQEAVDRPRAAASRSPSIAPATSSRRRPGWSRPSPACAAGTPSRTWRSWCAPTPRRGRSRTSSSATGFPTPWSAECASTNAPRSRTWSPTSACCAIRATASRCRGSSTSRRAASARRTAGDARRTRGEARRDALGRPRGRPLESFPARAATALRAFRALIHDAARGRPRAARCRRSSTSCWRRPATPTCTGARTRRSRPSSRTSASSSRRRRTSPSRRATAAARTRTCSPPSSITSRWSPTSTPGTASAASA